MRANLNIEPAALLAVGSPVVRVSAVLVTAALAVWLVAGVRLAVADLRTGLLPTRLIWPTAGIVWALYSAASLIEGVPAGLYGPALGATVCGALLAGVYFIHPPAMGFGDVRLSVLNALLCGWWAWEVALWGLTAGFVLAVPEALVVLVRHGRHASRPLGPYLLAGTAVAVVWAAATRGLVPVR